MKMQSIMFSTHRRTKEVRLGLEMSKSLRQPRRLFGSRVEPSQGLGTFAESRFEPVCLSSQGGTLWSQEESAS